MFQFGALFLCPERFNQTVYYFTGFFGYRTQSRTLFRFQITEISGKENLKFNFPSGTQGNI